MGSCVYNEACCMGIERCSELYVFARAKTNKNKRMRDCILQESPPSPLPQLQSLKQKKEVPTSFPCWCDVKLRDLIAGLSVFSAGCVALRLVFGLARKETKSCWPVSCTVSHEESFDNIYNLPLSLFVSLWFSRFSALEALLLVSMLIRCLHRSSKYTPPVW